MFGGSAELGKDRGFQPLREKWSPYLLSSVLESIVLEVDGEEKGRVTSLDKRNNGRTFLNCGHGGLYSYRRFCLACKYISCIRAIIKIVHFIQFH